MQRTLKTAVPETKTSPVPPKCGIGLRFQHHRVVQETHPDIAFLEVHSENFFGAGPAARFLENLSRDYPISLHGVGLSLGSATGLDANHLSQLCALEKRIRPGLISEHLSWSAIGGMHAADLLPLPMTEEALDVIAANVTRAQDALGRRLLVENPSSYIHFPHSSIPEWEFLATLSARTGCGILCDVNNIEVSAQNHGWDAGAYLAALPREAVGEIHLAGHSLRTLEDGSILRVDDHGSAVPDSVWTLYRKALELFGPVPTIMEWDQDIPEIDVLMAEAAKATGMIARTATHA